jgi:hypothetical protein
VQTKTKLMILAGLFPAALLAQRPFGVLTSSTPPDPATLVANQVGRLTSLLSLTTEQQAQATTIFTNASNAISPLQTTMRTDYTSLQTAVKQRHYDHRPAFLRHRQSVWADRRYPKQSRRRFLRHPDLVSAVDSWEHAIAQLRRGLRHGTRARRTASRKLA